ncbi:MAG: polysaccharide deacetylase family protein [Defluviitaleaceae bacterium]|nr:polysaccharide deacetylase family protein [Defluviitaleaceae bacterium]
MWKRLIPLVAFGTFLVAYNATLAADSYELVVEVSVQLLEAKEAARAQHVSMLNEQEIHVNLRNSKHVVKIDDVLAVDQIEETPGIEADHEVMEDLPFIEDEADTTAVRPLDPSRPMIALTFDDGPGIHTDQIREVFERHDGLATFFVIGRLVESGRDVMERLSDSGFEIVGHSWDHSDLSWLSASQIEDQLVSTHAAIEAVIGPAPMMYRPPFGAINQTVVDVSRDLGFSLIHWSIDPEDWRTRNAYSTYQHIMNTAYDGAIVVLHDIHFETVQAMELVVPALVERGFQLVTVSELFYHANLTPAPGGVYLNQTDVHYHLFSPN